jgi:hypothetical protein
VIVSEQAQAPLSVIAPSTVPLSTCSKLVHVDMLRVVHPPEDVHVMPAAERRAGKGTGGVVRSGMCDKEGTERTCGLGLGEMRAGARGDAGSTDDGEDGRKECKRELNDR